MAWPSAEYTLGETEHEAHAARSTWAAVANAIVRFEPVTMLVDPAHVTIARKYLDQSVELFEAELDDAWMRDIAPTFVRNEAGEIGAVDWVFNGWGQQTWAAWGKDSKVAKLVARLAGVPKIESPLINEGGGIHVNGAGAILLTETVQLGEGRNVAWKKSEVEEEIERRLGASDAIWIKRGLTRDYDEFGTRGHIDIVACFADETTILYHDQQDPTHPDYEVSQEVRATLEAAGNFRLVPLVAPKVLRDSEGWVDFSYINHYIINGAVILCSFDDENDLQAKQTLESVYPGREVVLVDARALFERGGGIHCITQQEPLAL
jgi:agmatine deiminase